MSGDGLSARTRLQEDLQSATPVRHMNMEQCTPDRATSRMVMLGLAVATVLAPVATDALAQPSKLETHRRAVRAHAVEEVYLAGRITEVIGVSEIVTDWTPAQLRANRLQDLDIVWMRLGDVAFRARLMTIDTYVAHNQSDSREIDTDTDAVMLLDDARSEVTLVGHSGALGTWTDASPGALVSLSATWFKGDR